MIRKITKFFDKLEDRVRGDLSRRPIIYTLIGAVAIVLFWRGVWMVADSIPFLTGPVSLVVSIVVLLITGLFVSFFIGGEIIISGLKKEKKIFEKAESEIESEESRLKRVESKLDHIERDVHDLGVKHNDH